ncbi:MAG: trypsin-like peptidase domain-containing protein [Anaerolineae bacterium]
MTSFIASKLEQWQPYIVTLRKQMRRARPFLSGALGALVMLVLYSLLNPPPPQLTPRDIENTVYQAMASATPRPAVASLVYQVIRPSLVVIDTTLNAGPGDQTASFKHDLTGDSFHLTQGEGVSSGVIVNDSGMILTSLHAVETAPDIQVYFSDGTQATAEIVSTLSDDDVAVLQTDVLPAEFVPAVLGNPNAMRIGDDAYVVGHPFGLQGSMSAGVISGFGRTYQLPSGKTMQDLIQVDAATNPGASGGPLVNRAGQVIGIVTALLNPTGQEVFVGVGFAVPITTAAGGGGGQLPR